VRFVDHVPYADVPAHYAMAGVYALPSSYEGLPFAILEAMAMRTPVAATAIPGVDEQIRNEVTGLLHPVGDVEALAGNLTRLLKDEALAERLVAEAWNVVDERFSWRVLGRATEAVLSRAAGVR
jgi:glycosyltransferase involved in cell wall biosynthesis